MKADADSGRAVPEVHAYPARRRRNSILAALLIASAVDIDAGGYVLRSQGLVPDYLTISTYVASLILVTVALLIYRSTNNRESIIGFLFAIIGVIISTNPAHLSALARFSSSAYIAVADVTMLVGFYILPVTYMVIFLFYKAWRPN